MEMLLRHKKGVRKRLMHVKSTLNLLGVKNRSVKEVVENGILVIKVVNVTLVTTLFLRVMYVRKVRH